MTNEIEIPAGEDPPDILFRFVDESGVNHGHVRLQTGVLLNALLTLRANLVDANTRWIKEQKKDGGHLAYVETIYGFSLFLQELQPFFPKSSPNTLKKILRDLYDVRERGITPMAFRPQRQSGGAASSSEVERNAVAAAALELHALAGDQINECAKAMANEMNDSGHRKRAKGQGGRSTLISDETVKGWRDAARREQGIALHREMFLDLVAEGRGRERDHAMALRGILRLIAPPPPE
ncbi:hypothetical protein IAI18_05305 [Acetobacteraceae bacterium H6797]|nr:hypothetical protein [Acetobacteraceae bacterium H6797]